MGVSCIPCPAGNDNTLGAHELVHPVYGSERTGCHRTLPVPNCKLLRQRLSRSHKLRQLTTPQQRLRHQLLNGYPVSRVLLALRCLHAILRKKRGSKACSVLLRIWGQEWDASNSASGEPIFRSLGEHLFNPTLTAPEPGQAAPLGNYLAPFRTKGGLVGNPWYK